MNQYKPTPRAVVATNEAAVRAFLVTHLEDRGFAVEQAYRAEYLLEAGAGADFVVLEVSVFLAFATGAERLTAHEFMVLTRSPSRAEEKVARDHGAAHYFAIPFDDAPALASQLDSIAARSIERAQAREAALV